MAALGNRGAPGPITIKFHVRRNYRSPKLPHPIQRKAHQRFYRSFADPIHWEMIGHGNVAGLNETEAFAGWSGKGRRKAVIAGPGPHAVIFRRHWSETGRLADGNPRGLILPNFPKDAWSLSRASAVSDYWGAAFWYAWEAGWAGRWDRNRLCSVGGWKWGEDQDEFDTVMEEALRLYLAFPRAACMAPLKALPVFTDRATPSAARAALAAA